MVSAAEPAGRRARTSVWLEGRARPSGRGGGRPAGLDRDRITGATVRLLDAEGPAGFSMRRLAAELNVTAMSVYWYVDTKDDLLELALDAAFGELPLPAPRAGADWRDELRTLARGYRALLVRHPWLSPLAATYPNIGPHALAFTRAVRRVVGEAGLPAHGVPGALSAVFQFVYGYGTIAGHFTARRAAAGMSRDEYVRHAPSAVARSPEAAEVVPESVATAAARGGGTVAETRERDFEFALDLLLAGIEAMAERTGNSPRGPRPGPDEGL